MVFLPSLRAEIVSCVVVLGGGRMRNPASLLRFAVVLCLALLSHAALAWDDGTVPSTPLPPRVRFVALVKCAQADLTQETVVRIDPTELKVGVVSYFKGPDLVVSVLPQAAPAGGVEFVFRLDKKVARAWQNVGITKFRTVLGERAHIITASRVPGLVLDIRFKTSNGASEKPHEVIPQSRRLNVPDRALLTPLQKSPSSTRFF